jgi:hypothetical protein
MRHLTSTPRSRHLLALTGFLALSVAYTWPLGRFLTSRVAHDPGDPVLNIWILWWNAQALPFTERWWSPPVFFPMDGAFALSEHLFGIALVTTPLQWAGASALTAANVALILSFVLSGFFTYLLVHYLLARAGAPAFAVTAGALCAGIAFAFSPYRGGHLSHLQVLTTQWMPLTLLAMHVWIDGGRRAWLLVAGGAWVVQALSNGYYLLFFPVLAALWMAWFVDWRRQWRRGLALAGAFAAASLLLVPGLLHYLTVHSRLGLARQISEMRMFSGGVRSFLEAPHALAFWTPGTTLNQELFLFPGLTVIALVVVSVAAAIVRRRLPFTLYPLPFTLYPLPFTPYPLPFTRHPLPFYVLASVLLAWLAFGPSVPEDGWSDRFRLYTLLASLPGFGGLRVPARFVMLAYLCLGIAAGLALGRLMPSRPAARAGIVALVFAGLFVDGWTHPLPVVAPPGRVFLPDVPGAAVLELPADEVQVNTAAMYRSIRHGRPLLNGYSGHVPAHYRILTAGLRRGDPTMLTTLAARRPLLVPISSALDRDGHFQRLVESVPGVEALDITNAGRLFLLPPQPLAVDPPAGDLLPHTWQEPAEEVAVLDLGAVRVVRLLEFPLRWHYAVLHGRMEIRASEDGETWTTVWLDWTGGLALRGALEDQREAPMRFTLPDVRARYLRVRPLPRVLMEEIAVYGPR